MRLVRCLGMVGARRAAEDLAGADGRAVRAGFSHALSCSRMRHVQHRDDRWQVQGRVCGGGVTHIDSTSS